LRFPKKKCHNFLPKGFVLGPNTNFLLFHMAAYMAQIWRQNFEPNQGKWAKVFLTQITKLGPN
jgi:hypothetical protein